MESLNPHLPAIWLFLIGFFLLYYVIADGANLGIGTLSLIASDESMQDAMMGSISRTWHNSQTWLVILGGMLFGAFPVFYALLLSSLYIPVLMMLVGLILRGVAFEFAEIAKRKTLWRYSFGIGSLLAATAQGCALGGLLGGLEVEGGRFSGSVWGWLNPFSLVVATGVVFGYIMLGANYLILKTQGAVQRQMGFFWARRAGLYVLLISVVVHLWLFLRYHFQKYRSAAAPEGYLAGVCLGLAAFGFGMFFYALARRREKGPFFWNAMVILFSFLGLSLMLYPDMIPTIISNPITVHEAAASPGTLFFMLIVTTVLLPIILVSTAYTYRVFKGKTDIQGDH